MIEVIPAIDIMEGRCVRLSRGDFRRRREYCQSPVEAAEKLESAGISRLHMVDLDGARVGRVMNLRVLKGVSRRTSLTIDFGGGIRSGRDLEKVLQHGASMITAGSVAVRDKPEFIRWISRFGGERFILAADVTGGRVCIDAWRERTGRDLVSLIEEYLPFGIRRVICTDISRDGMLKGPSLKLYSDLTARFPGIRIIASGGVRSLSDIRELASVGVGGVIVGRALYEGRITMEEIGEFLCWQRE